MATTEGRAGTRILVVEDDPAITFGLKTNLTFEHYEVEIVETRAAAVARAQAFQPDLIVLDLMLPDGSGFEVMEELQRVRFPGSILVLSARMAETDKVTALRMGADDYVTKPFSLAELLARINAILRRAAFNRSAPPPAAPPAAAPASGASPPGAPGVTGTTTTTSAAGNDPATADEEAVRFGACAIDPSARTLSVAGQPVTLTRLEFDLLLYFVQHAGRVLSRAQLLRDVWGLPHDGSARTVDNVIAHLRTKMGEDAERPRHLLTLRGAGYRFQLDPAPPRA